MRSITVLAVALLAVGCSSHSATPGSRSVSQPLVIKRPPTPDLIFVGGNDPASAPGGLYVATYYSGTVNEYGLPNFRNRPPKCSVPGTNVFGIGVNSKRILYVPSADGNIATFAPNCGPAGPTLKDTDGQPADVAFDGKTVYVDDSTTGAIDVFKNGSTKQTGTLSNPAISFSTNLGVAVNATHDVFESSGGTSPKSATVVEYVNGKGPGNVLPITDLVNPAGLEFDSDGRLIVFDDNEALIYKPPFSGPATRRLALKGKSNYGKLDRANKNLYVGDYQNGSIDVYKYPSGAYEYSITNGLLSSNSVQGVAVDPAAKN